MTRRNDGLLCSNERIWIPTKESRLLQRLLVIGHCGAQGHRVREALMNVIKRRFFVRHLSAVIKSFLADCLVCQHGKGEKVVNRPWAETFRCNKRNGALHWDFLRIGESYSNYKYLLVLKDDATHFVSSCRVHHRLRRWQLEQFWTGTVATELRECR
ncbi:hypothetical protein PHMEG_00015452 [Phytophthora megakarya]|uniref:Integrase zinc-binding domain-containing protein n=1 Tax=Phytophthora megakarya TaxID=4795 RepID=A0A225W1R3_9STRA|nr:hypothetical protein PHMEG_00015452 [Phytophthora megakarya]